VGQLLGWRALFLGSLVLMLLVIPLARRALPSERAAGARGFDVVGGVLLGLAAGLFLFGITQGQVAGFASDASRGSFLGAALAAAGFVWRINRAPDPFVPPALFRNRAYVAVLLVGFFAMLVNLSALVVAPLLLVDVNGLSPGRAGIALTPAAVAVAILSPAVGRLSDRVGARTLVLTGLGLMGLAALLLSTFGAGGPAPLVSLGMIGFGCGAAFLQSPANNAAANALPDAEVGAGMGMFAGAFFLGGATGPALAGALLAARQEADAAALNPVYSLTAAPFSDAFLAMIVPLLLAAVAALGMRPRTERAA
jgi:DHA2 family metal-tetracycline-proton antiporter-like MFS transporter/DHA2 family florfenicol/chloramphenicol resistance protein-like MFS transporter